MKLVICRDSGSCENCVLRYKNLYVCTASYRLVNQPGSPHRGPFLAGFTSRCLALTDSQLANEYCLINISGSLPWPTAGTLTSGHERTGPSSVGATTWYVDKGLLLYIYDVSRRYTSVHVTRMPVKLTIRPPTESSTGMPISAQLRWHSMSGTCTATVSGSALWWWFYLLYKRRNG